MTKAPACGAAIKCWSRRHLVTCLQLTVMLSVLAHPNESFAARSDGRTGRTEIGCCASACKRIRSIWGRSPSEDEGDNVSNIVLYLRGGSRRMSSLHGGVKKGGKRPSDLASAVMDIINSPVAKKPRDTASRGGDGGSSLDDGGSSLEDGDDGSLGGLSDGASVSRDGVGGHRGNGRGSHSVSGTKSSAAGAKRQGAQGRAMRRGSSDTMSESGGGAGAGAGAGGRGRGGSGTGGASSSMRAGREHAGQGGERDLESGRREAAEEVKRAVRAAREAERRAEEESARRERAEMESARLAEEARAARSAAAQALSRERQAGAEREGALRREEAEAEERRRAREEEEAEKVKSERVGREEGGGKGGDKMDGGGDDDSEEMQKAIASNLVAEAAKRRDEQKRLRSEGLEDVEEGQSVEAMKEAGEDKGKREGQGGEEKREGEMQGVGDIQGEGREENVWAGESQNSTVMKEEEEANREENQVVDEEGQRQEAAAAAAAADESKRLEEEGVRRRQAEDDALCKCAMVEASIEANEIERAREHMSDLSRFASGEAQNLISEATRASIDAVGARVGAAIKRERDRRAGEVEMERGRELISEGDWDKARASLRTARAAFARGGLDDNVRETEVMLAWADEKQSEETLAKAGDAADRVEKLLQTVRKTIGLGAAGEQAARAAAAAATNHGPCV